MSLFIERIDIIIKRFPLNLESIEYKRCDYLINFGIIGKWIFGRE